MPSPQAFPERQDKALPVGGNPALAALVTLLALAGLLAASPPTLNPPDPPPATALPTPLPIDHHVHVLGPGLLRDWKAMGATFSRPDDAYSSARGVLGDAGPGDGSAPVARALLVPMGHLYGNSEFREGLRLSVEEERARLAAENDHVAREAGRYPGRATALCSVSVLRPYAWDELRRCRSELGAAGIKLHLASSEVDLRNAEHLAAVERVVGWAVAEKLVLLVHLDPQRPGTEAADVERFARAVLQPHPDAVLIVAHLGGSGGYGPWTRAVFRTLLEWLEERARAGDPRRGLFFDVSAALLERESEGVPATTADEAAALGDDLHRAGVERLLFGSDHPVFDPRRYAELLLERAVLTPAAAATLLANRPPSVFSP